MATLSILLAWKSHGQKAWRAVATRLQELDTCSNEEPPGKPQDGFDAGKKSVPPPGFQSMSYRGKS